MSKKKLVAALKAIERSNKDIEALEAIAKARNAVLESRIAAIMWIVAGSTLPIVDATFELILSLTKPNWESRIDDPLTAPFGENIVRVTRNLAAQRSEAMTPGIMRAWNFVQQAKDPSAIPSEAADLLLRSQTGKNATWWFEWIRAELEKSPPSAG